MEVLKVGYCDMNKKLSIETTLVYFFSPESNLRTRSGLLLSPDRGENSHSIGDEGNITRRTLKSLQSITTYYTHV